MRGPRGVKPTIACILTLTDAERAEKRCSSPAEPAGPLPTMHPENEAASGGTPSGPCAGH